jgi:FKBP-type peptidyl-prolyl cis-trans isomerase
MKNTFRFVSALLLVALPLAAADKKPTPAPKPAAAAPATSTAAPAPPPAAKPMDPAEKEKTFYSLGQMLARNLGVFSMSESELKSVQDGLSDGVLNRPAKVKAEEYMPKVQELAKERMAAAGEKEKAAGAVYLEKAAAEPGAVKKPSGLIYKETAAGTGSNPKATDKVKVHYTGTLTDGTVFDSSVQRGQPVDFPLNGVIPCWTEGVQLMKVGGKARLVCPSALAYGDNPPPGGKIKPGSTLVFEVELLGIEEASNPGMPAGHPTIAPPPAAGSKPVQPEKK